MVEEIRRHRQLIHYQLQYIDEVLMMQKALGALLGDQVEGFQSAVLNAFGRVLEKGDELEEGSVDQLLLTLVGQADEETGECANASLAVLPILVLDGVRGEVKHQRLKLM